MKTFVRAEINILICSSRLPSPHAKAQNYLRTSDLTELFCHEAAYQSCVVVLDCLPFMLTSDVNQERVTESRVI